MESRVGNNFNTIFKDASNKRFFITPKKQETPDERRVNKALKNSAIVAGAGVLVLSPLVIAATRGKLPKNISNFLSNNLKRLNKSIETLRNKPTLNKFERFSLNVLQKADKGLNTTKNMVLTTAPLKDVLCEKGLRKIKLGKVCDKITGFFERMAIKMNSIAYQKSGNAFKNLTNTLETTNKTLIASGNTKEVTINGVTKTVTEWAKTAGEKTAAMDKSYDAFRPEEINKRYKWLASKFKGLGDRVYDKTYGQLKKYITSKSWTSFISEEMVAPQKEVIGKVVSGKKSIITHDSSDSAKMLKSALSKIEENLNMKDEASVSVLKQIKKLISGYNLDAVSKNPELKEKLLKEITEITEKTAKVINPDGHLYTKESTKIINKNLRQIKHIISTDKKGEMEELMDIYKHILPEKEYTTIKAAAKKSKAALDNATYTESEKFVDKLRDLNTGSALTDVGFGILVPTASTAVGMSMANTKEKKRSVFLNLGIPLFVGLATSMVGTVAMLAAAPSMVLGIVTSTITNRVCSTIDKNLKKKSGMETGKH